MIDPATIGIRGIPAIRTSELGELRGVEGAGAASRAQESGTVLPEVFADALAQARATEQTAVQMSERFAAGDPSVGIHETMIAAEEANISLRFATTLKNKALEAYRELMNTQV